MSDTTLTPDKSTWQALFDDLAVGRDGQPVSIEVLDLDFGDQTEAERMPFRSVSYDEKGDVIIVALGGVSSRWPVVLRHLVHRPRRVDVLEHAEGGMVLRFVDADDAATLLTFAP